MTNGARGSVLAFFFVLGMAFMGAMFLYVRPDWGWHERARVIEEPAKTKFVSYTKKERIVVTQPAVAEQTIVEPTPDDRRLSQPAASNTLNSESPQQLAAEIAKPIPPSVVRNNPEGWSPGSQSSSYWIRPPSSWPLSDWNLAAGKSLRGRAFLDGSSCLATPG